MNTSQKRREREREPVQVFSINYLEIHVLHYNHQNGLRGESTRYNNDPEQDSITNQFVGKHQKPMAKITAHHKGTCASSISHHKYMYMYMYECS